MDAKRAGTAGYAVKKAARKADTSHGRAPDFLLPEPDCVVGNTSPGPGQCAQEGWGSSGAARQPAAGHGIARGI